ncbi:MAG: TIGR00266 family protein [Nitrosopumilaceae archaeon]|nr:TIGR00266 family protein [Nitrosopumilaceae archaeon]
MRHHIRDNPMGVIEFEMGWGDVVNAEAASMVWMRGDLAVETKQRRGGLLKSLKSSVLSGESFFINEYTANADGCSLGITGNALGDLASITVDRQFYVQSGSYVCSTGDLTLDTQWQGFKRGLFGTNLFTLKTVGEGELFVDCWGALRSHALEPGEEMIIDNYQIVAFEEMSYDVIKHGNMKTTIFGGDALVTQFVGPGTVYYSTKNPMEVARALAPYMQGRGSKGVGLGMAGMGVGLAGGFLGSR